MEIFGFISGLLLLVAGAELLVRGACRLARVAGLSPLVVGLTVVAFGTSAPELAVSVKAALSHQGAVALGNVIGSNTFNVLVILGLSAIITPLAVSSQLVRFDVPIMAGVSLGAWFLASDGLISRVDGLLLFVLFVGYNTLLFILAKKANASGTVAAEEVIKTNLGSGATAFALVIVGLTLLIFGSRLLVDAAATIATRLGVSEMVVGLTIVAAGTSLPEVVTSVVASIRGEREIAVGNVVGSNIFNLLCVLCAASLCAPAGIQVSSKVLSFDFPVMVAAALICLPIFFTRFSVDRWEGALLLGLYVAYTTSIVVSV